MKPLAVAVATLLGVGSAGAQEIQITRAGSQPPADGPAERFTGSVKVQPLFGATAPARTSGGLVTFQPGAHSAWHTHPLGQTLIVTAGVGRVQRWGGPVEEIHPGDVVWIPPGLKHWHGAAPSSSMSHIAIQEQLNGNAVDWMEKVTDAQYAVAPAGKQPSTPTTAPLPSQKSLGDFAPKLVDLTSNVLFADVWERPQLSKRDRSLITCAALVATGKTEQMDFHFPYAIKNGVTQDELVEMITHLAFYVGWPSAMSAMNRAKDLLTKKQP